MFNQAGAFIDLDRQIRGELKVADGNYIPIRGFGTVALWKAGGGEHLALINNVLYIFYLNET